MVSHVTTNGTLIDIDKVLDSGLKSIYFSMQGLNNDEYAKLRNTDKFPLLERKIQELMYERKKRALDYPFVQVNTSITDETKDEQQVFLTKWKQIVDDVSISYTWLKRLEDKSLVKEWVDRSPELPHLFQCNEVRSKLAVHWDGTVTPCCEDYDEAFNLGNAFNNSLQEIWDSPLATGIRLILSVHGKQDLFSLCEKCELCHDFRGNLK
jgi:radical SAM protein with 4Fe4S-binding SPASM domain